MEESLPATENITLKTLFKKQSLIAFLKIFLPGILFLGVMVCFSKVYHIHFSFLTRDPIQLLDGKPYIGILSNVGILLWCATAAILFYSFQLSLKQGKPKSLSNFFLFSGFLTLLLLIDDLFLMHDVIFPDYLHINEKVFFLFYGFSVVALVYFFLNTILNTDYILLILAFGLLGISAITDTITEMGIPIPDPFLIEDGCKFLGIISWFAYFTRGCYKNIKPTLKKEL